MTEASQGRGGNQNGSRQALFVALYETLSDADRHWVAVTIANHQVAEREAEARGEISSRPVW
jgi:hypothetical protein